jgi:uncharacterized membrane protein (GlpM family)
MSPLVYIGLKALAGGLLVVAFSLLAEAVQPKRFAGVFSAAPAIALASLLLTAYLKGTSMALAQTSGMLLGSAAMVVYCAFSLFAVDRFRALLGSIGAWAAWFVVAGGLYLVLER